MGIPRKIERAVLFGGAGLVGIQIARNICQTYAPSQLVICALFEQECVDAVKRLKDEFPHIADIRYEYGNIFVRKEYAQEDRRVISSDDKILGQIYQDVFGEINDKADNIGQQNLMGQIIEKYKPDVVVDCVNTATGISYQDVKSSSQVLKEFRDQLSDQIHNPHLEGAKKASAIESLSTRPLEAMPHLNNLKMIDLLLVSQSIPQLVRHVVLLYQAMIKADTHMYIKVGTTGTGGMGINIPYTHGEDKPSFTLMTKSAVGFAHTGLLFLLARSPGPIIKEVKPGAMIGYRQIDFRNINKFRRPVKKWESKKIPLQDQLCLNEEEKNYHDKGPLQLVGIDTGENGFFTRAEFQAISYLHQMEFVTPEEIAGQVLREINGANTGKDVIAAIDGAIIDPSYRAGYIRQTALDQMSEKENSTGIPSIAIGELGPPQLSKLLYEVHLLEQFYPEVAKLAASDLTPEKMSQTLEGYVQSNAEICNMMTSLGLPILLGDGKTLIRGPHIHIPESKIHQTIKIQGAQDIDLWAKQGWVDLRPANMKVWKERALKMMATAENPHTKGSAVYRREAYHSQVLKAGEVVGWIFVNEFQGGRIV